jgi:hypothetical protein
MYDLDTIKRMNRAPSKRNARDKPAPQPTKTESRSYSLKARIALDWRAREMQSPADDTKSGYLVLE